VIGIPDAFARSTVEREGSQEPRGSPSSLESWTSCWAAGGAFRTARYGGVGIVVPVRRRAGRPGVVKVSFPHPGHVHEPDAFAAWGGRGAVLLHERDDERFAMLLERAQMSNLAELEDGDEAAAIAGRLSRRLAIPGPAPAR
jgi:streptomycin 6-kinase